MTTKVEIDRLNQDKTAAKMLGYSRGTIWRRVADGTIPQPVRVHGLTRWPESEILEVIERAKKQRGATK